MDIQAGGFWGASRHERAYFDVRVFYPHARSHCHRSLPQIYRSQEMEKRRQYQERILNVDGGTFTPLVFSAMGGAGPAASTFLKCLADKIATKKSTTYAQALGWLRCRLSFALLRSSLLCLRGARCNNTPVNTRSIRPSDAPPEPHQPDLAKVEAQIKSALVSFSGISSIVAWIAIVLLCLVFSINLIPFFDICSALVVLSPWLFGYVLLYLGHCVVATIAVCGFGSWSLVFHCGMPRQISPLPPTPSQTEACSTMGESIRPSSL